MNPDDSGEFIVSIPIRVLVFRVGHAPAVAMLTADDKGAYVTAMQAIVGGALLAITVGAGIDLWCNDDAIALGLPLTCIIRTRAPTVPEGFEFIEVGEDLARPGEIGAWHIRGDYFLARCTDEGDVADLTDEDIAFWIKLSLASRGL